MYLYLYDASFLYFSFLSNKSLFLLIRSLFFFCNFSITSLLKVLENTALLNAFLPLKSIIADLKPSALPILLATAVACFLASSISIFDFSFSSLISLSVFFFNNDNSASVCCFNLFNSLISCCCLK